MTQLTPYRPAASTRTVTALKAVSATALVLAGAALAFVAGVVATIVYSGCFLECGDPEPLSGLLLGALSLALLLAGPLVARLMWRRTTTVAGALAWLAVLVLLPLSLVMPGLLPLR
jgi:hypothetical protein